MKYAREYVEEMWEYEPREAWTGRGLESIPTWVKDNCEKMVYQVQLDTWNAAIKAAALRCEQETHTGDIRGCHGLDAANIRSLPFPFESEDK